MLLGLFLNALLSTITGFITALGSSNGSCYCQVLHCETRGSIRIILYATSIRVYRVFHCKSHKKNSSYLRQLRRGTDHGQSWTKWKYWYCRKFLLLVGTMKWVTIKLAYSLLGISFLNEVTKMQVHFTNWSDLWCRQVRERKGHNGCLEAGNKLL